MTAPVVIVNVSEVDPAGTVTLAGTLAALVFELLSDTTAPPEGAAVVRVTVPVPDCPLVVVLELTVTPLSAAEAACGLMVTTNVSPSPLYVAVKVTGVGLVTDSAPTVNVVEVEPCGIVTLDGRLASAGDELRATAAAAGAL